MVWRESRVHHNNAVKPGGGLAMGETVEVMISVLFFGGWLFFLSWAWGRVGYKMGYSFWAFALTFWVIIFAIISIILLGLRIHVGHETLELVIGVSYYGGFFILSGWAWGGVARKLGHSFWAYGLTFWLAPVTLLYLGFRREKRQTPVDSSQEETSRNSPSEGT
jgi:hypothetical protein